MSSPASARLRSFASALIRARYVLLPLALILVGLAWPVSQRLAFDRSIESLYAPDDPRLQEYLASKAWFGGDEFVIVAYFEPELFQPGSIESKDYEFTEASVQRMEELAAELNAVPGVIPESTQKLTSAMKFPFGRRRARQLVEGILVGGDDHTTAVVVRLDEQREIDAGVTRSETVARIRQLAADFGTRHNLPAIAGGDSVYVVGEPVQVNDLFRYVEEDGRMLFWWSLALLAIVIIGLFRSLRWVTLPLAVVVVTIVWTEAVLVLSRLRLSMVSSIMNSLVTIIGIATVMHITVRYREKRQDHERIEALRETLAELSAPIFWTCATTAAGFAALLSSQITPVYSFGTMMALATILVLPACATLLPGGILIGNAGADPRDTPAEDRLVGFLGRITGWVDRRPLWVTGGMAAVVLFSLAGFQFLEVETDFSKNFRASSPIVRALGFVETKLGGAGSWEVNFPAPAELTPEYLDRVRSLSAKLRSLSTEEDLALTKVTSLTDGLDMVPYVPILLNTIEKRLTALTAIQPEYAESLYNPEAGRMRIVLRALERQPSEAKLRLIGRVQELAREEFPPSEFPDEPPAVATGIFVMLTFLIESLLGDQWTSFAWAAFGIVTLMTIAFRSLWIGLMSLLPNVFPIVLVIGGMGWVGLPVNIATAMIASVSMGLTVDSSIHYITSYQRERSGGRSVADALRITHGGVGRALVFANVALVVGFSVLTLSHFIPLVYFGILVSVAMLGGLAGNLVLLPLLLKWWDRRGEQAGEIRGDAMLASGGREPPGPSASSEGQSEV